MSKERTITIIPPTPKLMYRVAIYCRVSTRSQEQLDSLANQISYLTKLTATKVNWRLIDIYIDIKSGSDATSRNEFQRMIDDCETGKIDMIVTKSISRFGRNTATTLSTLNNLHGRNIDVYFENEEIHTKDGQNTFIISLLEGIAQEESTNRSKNISWGILRRVESGDAQLLRRKCYGYYPDNQGNLQIQDKEAQVVKLIFDMYLHGTSIIRIIRELENQSIISPTGKTKWCKRTIESITSENKYSYFSNNMI
jgi:site-specific DNA recombinase